MFVRRFSEYLEISHLDAIQRYKLSRHLDFSGSHLFSSVQGYIIFFPILEPSDVGYCARLPAGFVAQEHILAPSSLEMTLHILTSITTGGQPRSWLCIHLNNNSRLLNTVAYIPQVFCASTSKYAIIHGWACRVDTIPDNTTEHVPYGINKIFCDHQSRGATSLRKDDVNQSIP